MVLIRKPNAMQRMHTPQKINIVRKPTIRPHTLEVSNVNTSLEAAKELAIASNDTVSSNAYPRNPEPGNIL